MVTEDWAFVHHRQQIAQAVRAAGHELVVASPDGGRAGEIAGLGFPHHVVRFDRRNLNPFRDVVSTLDLVRLYRRLRPDLVHHFALKPIVHGTLAARLCGVKAVVNSVTGLGYVFSGTGGARRLLRHVTRGLFRLSLRSGRVRTIFQNQEDLDLFVRSGLVREPRSSLIRGSGVDTARLRPRPEPEGVPAILLASRMLWDKGIGELIEAGRALRAEGLHFRLLLAGTPDPRNPASIGEAQLRAWHEEGAAEWLGYRRDIPELLAASHVACLPSYREGLPLFLLEAAASGRPVVTTDVTGCREVVRHGETGLLVERGSIDGLAGALRGLLGDRELRERMGLVGRRLAEEHFSVQRVAGQTLELYRELTGGAA